MMGVPAGRILSNVVPHFGWFLVCLCGCGLPVISFADPAFLQQAGRVQAPPVTLVISGEVANRKEIWDRRPNPLMGRPDILKEIILYVNVSRLIEGDLSTGMQMILVSLKGDSTLTAYRHLAKGWRGTFHLAGGGKQYELVEFTDGIVPETRPGAVIVPTKTTTGNTLGFPDNIGGREMKGSKQLQDKAVREIARKYGMTEASAVFLTSNSGPCPPPGGYDYWGVKGLIGGKWHIWQAGGYGRPREGTRLEDPKRYQK